MCNYVCLHHNHTSSHWECKPPRIFSSQEWLNHAWYVQYFIDDSYFILFTFYSVFYILYIVLYTLIFYTIRLSQDGLDDGPPKQRCLGLGLWCIMPRRFQTSALLSDYSGISAATILYTFLYTFFILILLSDYSGINAAKQWRGITAGAEEKRPDRK